MIGVDTNIILRYLLQDDERQTPQAYHLLHHVCSEENPAFVSIITVAEVAWVLQSGYRYDRETLAGVLARLFLGKNLKFENREALWRSWYNYKYGTADFADCLIAQVNRRAGCETTYTFDKKAAREGAFTLVG